MAEYIDRNLIEWYGCDYKDDLCKECSGCSHAKCSHAQVMQIPTADVIEREKIEQAIAEIKDGYYGNEEKSETDSERADAFNNGLSYALEILDKLIEREGK